MSLVEVHLPAAGHVHLYVHEPGEGSPNRIPRTHRKAVRASEPLAVCACNARQVGWAASPSSRHVCEFLVRGLCVGFAGKKLSSASLRAAMVGWALVAQLAVALQGLVPRLKLPLPDVHSSRTQCCPNSLTVQPSTSALYELTPGSAGTFSTRSSSDSVSG